MIVQAKQIFTLLICGMLFPASFVVQATITPPVPKNKISSVSMSNGSQPIVIQLTKKPFTDVIARIELQSNIKIQIVPFLKNHLITANIHAKNWETAIPKLLNGYNWVGFINETGQTTRILVTGINDTGTDAPKPPKELFSYADKNLLLDIPDHLKQLSNGSVFQIKFNKAMLKKMALGEVLSLSLPTGQFNVIHDNFMLDENGNFTWIGYLENMTPKNRVVISFDNKSSFGRILTPDGVFRVESSQGLDWLVDVVSAGLNPGSLQKDSISIHPPGIDQSETDGELIKGTIPLITQQTTSIPFKINSTATKDITNSTRTPGDRETNEPTARVDSISKMITIDVMVLYTKGLMINRINNLIAISNQAFIDSKVQIQLRLVHTQRVQYTNHNRNETALYDLSNDHISSLFNISALRQRHGADLVSLVRPFSADAHQGCGIAWLGGSGGRNYNEEEAFSIISDGIDEFSYCTDYTFVHELSHNMGSTHDRLNARHHGRFPYSYGYNVDGRYGTIMSYSAIELGIFSNPNIYCLDQPCGINEELPNEANNALSLNNSAAAIAGFMQSVYPLKKAEKLK